MNISAAIRELATGLFQLALLVSSASHWLCYTCIYICTCESAGMSVCLLACFRVFFSPVGLLLVCVCVCECAEKKNVIERHCQLIFTYVSLSVVFALIICALVYRISRVCSSVCSVWSIFKIDICIWEVWPNTTFSTWNQSAGINLEVQLMDELQCSFFM